METEYKPTHEQLEKAVAFYDHTLDSIIEHAKHGNSLPANAEHTAQSLRLIVDDAQEALNETRHLLAPPPPTYEEVTVERWECKECGRVYLAEECDPMVCDTRDCTSKEFNPLPFTRRVPVKQPVRRSVQAEISHNGEGLNVDDLTVFPPDGTPVTISWEE